VTDAIMIPRFVNSRLKKENNLKNYNVDLRKMEGRLVKSLPLRVAPVRCLTRVGSSLTGKYDRPEGNIMGKILYYIWLCR
jgi:hypothetical protein